MTKAELVEEVSRVSDLTKKHSEVIVDTVFQSIIDALHRGEKIELRGFGSFRLRTSPRQRPQGLWTPPSGAGGNSWGMARHGQEPARDAGRDAGR